jgi:hypothetical protein
VAFYNNLINIVQYIQTVESIGFYKKNNNENPFAIIYFPENHFLKDCYSKLNVDRKDFGRVVVPKCYNPSVCLDSKIFSDFSGSGFFVQDNFTTALENNVLVDLSYFLEKYHLIFKPITYTGFHEQKVSEYMENLISSIDPIYRKVLIYSIDYSKQYEQNYINRKVQIIISQLDKNPQLLDYVLFCSLDNRTNYKLLVKDKEFNITTIKNILRTGEPIHGFVQ